MASPVVDVILRARDEASAKIRGLASGVSGLNGVVARFGAAAGPIGAVAAASVSAGLAIVGAAQKHTDFAEHLALIARASGATAAQVQVMEAAFYRSGSSTEVADKALINMSRSLGVGKKSLSDMGIHTTNAYEALEQFGKAAGNTSDAGQRMRVSVDLLGKAGRQAAGVIPVLTEALEKSEGALRSTGGLMTNEVTKAALELNDRMKDLGTAWGGVWINMANTMLPVAAAMVKWMENMTNNSGGAASGATQMIRAFGPLALIVADMTDNILTLVGALLLLVGAILSVSRNLLPGGNMFKIGPDVKKSWEDLFNLIDSRAKRLVGTERILNDIMNPRATAPLGGMLGAHTLTGPMSSLRGVEGMQGVEGAGLEDDTRAKTIASIERAMKVTTLEATALFDRIQDVKREWTALQGLAELRILGPEFAGVANDALNKLDAIKRAQTILDLKREIRLLGPDASKALRDSVATIDVLTAKRALLAAQKEVRLLGPNAPKELKDVAVEMEAVRLQKEILLRQRTIEFLSPDAANGLKWLRDTLRGLDIEESVLKRGDELARRLRLSTGFARELAGALHRMGEEDAALADKRTIMPSLVAEAETIAHMGEALGMATEAAREFLLKLTGISKVPLTANEEALKRFGAALHKNNMEAARSQQIQALKPLLSSPDTSREDKGVLSRLLTEDDLETFIRRLDEATSAYGVFSSAAQSISENIGDAVGGIFKDMVGSTMTLGRALVAVWKSVLNSITQVIGEFIRSQVVKFFLKLLLKIAGAVLTGNPAVIGIDLLPDSGTRLARAGPSGDPATFARRSSFARSEASRAASPSDQRTFVINAIDAHDIVASLLLPGGGMRRANDRLSIAGAY
jgi:hypothetical protein